MRNYNWEKLVMNLLRKSFFLVNVKKGVGGWDCIYIYVYICLCSLCFGVTLLIFENSKKKLYVDISVQMQSS